MGSFESIITTTSAVPLVDSNEIHNTG